MEWLTYGSGYLAGMKLGDTPLVEYTRDRLHREVQRRFGSDSLPDSYELTTAYNPGGQVQGRHLNHPQLDREYGYDNAGWLVRISGPQQTREYRYSGAGRLTGVHTTAANLDITLPYATDPAGNRLPDPAFYPQSSSTVWADNRITEDMQYRYRYDRYGRLTEKTDRIPEGVIRMHDERTHRYDYDNQHRLVRYVRTQYGETQAEGRYVYDPAGRRVGKRVWKREPVHWSETRTELSARPYETWYGWEGDRLTTVQTQQRRVQTVYAPGSFTPLLRVETENTELAKTRHRSLAEKLEQEGSENGEAVQFPAALRAMLDRLEDELRRDAVSEASRAWLTQCGLTAEQMKNQLEPRPEPERKIHLYHCDHRGLPLALISPDNTVVWRAEYDEWGNQLSEENPEHLEQLIRLPGQQYDEESGLHYNRHRYYSPGQGRYITQDPIGLKGGWNLYQYPLNPVVGIDPLGLKFVIEGDRKDFDAAINYLKQDSEMKKIITEIEKSEKYTITVSCNSEHDNSYNAWTKRIHWDPKTAIYCDDTEEHNFDFKNGTQVPAFSLGHEIAHAHEHMKHGYSAYIKRSKTPDSQYDDAEERRVITGPETHAAKTLKQCVRKNHGGINYHSSGPLEYL
ncbi:RHS family protein [Salmonella enterica subsp. salamae]|nr:RHS family protein [Salmonella enterica subsp. salamae]